MALLSVSDSTLRKVTYTSTQTTDMYCVLLKIALHKLLKSQPLMAHNVYLLVIAVKMSSTWSKIFRFFAVLQR